MSIVTCMEPQENTPEPDYTYVYTWDDAVADGTFVQLSGRGYPKHGDAWVPQMVAEAGIRLPLALTREVFHDCVMPIGDDYELAPTQDSKGRLWDVLWMMGFALRGAARRGGSEATFELRVVKNCRAGKPKWTRPRKVKLCVSIGPRSVSDPSPVLTVYYPSQR